MLNLLHVPNVPNTGLDRFSRRTLRLLQQPKIPQVKFGVTYVYYGLIPIIATD